MGINSKSHYDSFGHFPPIQRKSKFWDPIATLGIINPSKGCLTCVGYAPSRKRRCLNPINHQNRESAFLLLEALSYVDTSTTDINEKLHQLARLTLCVRYHQGQNSSMVQIWLRQISQQQQWKDIVESYAYKREKIQEADEFTFPLPKGQRYRKEYDPQSTQQERARKRQEEDMRDLKERERERRQQEREKREREEKERKKSDEEKQRKKCRQEEQRKREQEEQRKKEQEARDKEASEREERNERIRQRAEQARKERERKAKEQAEREREEWGKVWLRYVMQWDEIKRKDIKGTSKKLQEIIPWPVKSGDYKDVSGSAVEEFFRKAAPKDTGAEKMLAIMKMECLKWHADRIPRMFGVIEDKPLATLFNTVAQVVIKIRAEIGRQRGQ